MLTKDKGAYFVPSNNLRAKKVVVIDDDREMRELLRDMLVKEGFEVEIFDSGASALSEIERPGATNVADVVICDVIMPDMDGREFTKRLKKAFLKVPVILITGFGSALSRREALGAGASYLLTKPFGISELLEALKLVI